MTWVVVGVVVLAALAVGGAVAYRVHLRRLFDRTDVELPFYQVATLDAGPGTTRARLVLGGTESPLELRSISAHAEAALGIGFRPPPGFRETDEVAGESRRAWRPEGPLSFAPGEPVELEFGYDPAADGTVPVFGHTGPDPASEGTGAGFTVLVGRRSPLEVEASNLRSELIARAREREVPPPTLPEWSRLEELEDRLAAGRNEEEGGRS